MNKFIFILIMMFVIPVYADIGIDALGSAGFNNLSQQQKADIIKQITDKAAQVNNEKKISIDNVDVDESKKWTELSSNIGKALAGTARELGVAVGDFAKSSIGQLVTVLIIWHLFGSQVLHIFGALTILAVGFTLIRFMVRSAYPPMIEYSKTEKNIFGNYVKTAEINESISSDMIIVICIIAVFTIGIASVMIGTI